MAVQYSIVRVCLIAIASLDIPTSIRDFHFIDRIGIRVDAIEFETGPN